MIKKIGLKLLLPLFLLTFLLGTSSSVHAQSTNPFQVGIAAGFDGYCKENSWLPIQITVENSGGDFSGSLNVHIGNDPETDYAFPVVLAGGSTKRINTQIFLHTYSPTITLRMVSAETGDDVIKPQQIDVSCATSRDFLVAVVGNDASAYTILNQINPNNGLTYIATVPADSIPDQATSLESLNVILLSNVDSTQFSAAQLDAIHNWVQNGGHLILTGGTLWQTNLAGFVDLLPQKIETARTTTVLQAFNAFDTTMVMEGIVVSSGPLAESSISLLAEDDDPVVSRRIVGAGFVTLLNFDPTVPDFRGWLALETFYRHILNTGSIIQFTQNSYDRWSFLSDAATQFSSLALPPVWLVCGYLLFYILIIGPINYIVLAQIKRREWAWVTIPALIVMFTLATIFTGWGLRGSSASLNQLAIIDIYPGEATSSVDGIAGLFSPSRETYHLTASTGFSLHQTPNRYYNYSSTNWQFISQAGAPDQGETRVDTGGIAVVGVKGSIPTPKINVDFHLDAAKNNLVLRGTLSNHSGTDLKDMVIIYPGGNRVKAVGDLADGDEIEIEIMLGNSGYAQQGIALPFDVVGESFTPDYYYYSGSIYVDQVLGVDYFGSSDLRQRSNILQAALREIEGFTLIGWSDETPYQLTLEESNQELIETSLFVVHLSPTFDQDAAKISIPPAMFSWYLLDYAGGYYSTAYNMHLNAHETYSLAFQLDPSIQFSEVTALTLHLAGSSGLSKLDLQISLWDYSKNAWQVLDITDWGDWTIPSPSHYVGPNRQIKLQIADLSVNNYYDIERSDFTLIVEP